MRRSEPFCQLLAALGMLVLAAPAVASPAGPDARPRPSAREEAAALVDRWLAAQNDGNFEAYMGLYASRFHGVRRSGKRTVRLDLAGWRKDRARMFAKKMHVEASNVMVAVGAKTTEVQLTQRWSSGSYSDEGSKVMVLVPSPSGQLQILSEEQLDSYLTDTPRWLDETARGQFAFVERGRVVLATGGLSCESPSPRKAKDEHEVEYDVRRCVVTADKVPKPLAAWTGAKVVIRGGGSADGPEAKPCEATVVSFELAQSRYPSMYEERSETVSGWSATPAVLLGVLDKSCGGEGQWARLAALPPVDVAGPGSLKGPSAEAFWFAVGVPVSANYDPRAAASLVAYALPTAAGGGTLAMSWDDPSCGEEGERFSAIMVATTAPTSWRALGEELVWRKPVAVVDVDGDGAVEIFVAQPSTRAMREAVVLRKGADGKYVRTGRIVLRTTGPNPC